MRIDGFLVVDYDGTECADLDAAVEEARASARDLIGEHIKSNDPSVLLNSFEITDEPGVILTTKKFTEGLREEFKRAIRYCRRLH
ncbi:hypothetical protein Sa4125_21510 [Aureimonas sp. SA4125]|nr:hypothetical protein Sa4125_21510 [Aureimonas sp. SA4125]